MIEYLVHATIWREAKLPDRWRRKDGKDPFLLMYQAHEGYRSGEDPPFQKIDTL